MASISPALPSPGAAPAHGVYNELDEAAFRELDNLSLKEILDQDSRPALVIDLDPDYIVGHAIRPIFCNAALRLHDRLLDSITGAANDFPHDAASSTDGAASYDEFVDWATETSRFNDSKDFFSLTIQYHGLLWTSSTIRSRWRIISGNALYKTSDIPKGNLNWASPKKPKKKPRNAVRDRLGKSTAPLPEMPTMILPLVEEPHSETASVSLSRNTSKVTTGTTSSVTLASPENAVPDWTAANFTGALTEHVAFARKVDWSHTPLGPMHSWSLQFRELVNVLMRNPHPAALFWGEDLTMIYNDAYKIEVAGNKHPDLMGTGMLSNNDNGET